MKKLCNVVMLPTEKAEGYGLLKTNNSTKLEYCGDRYFTQSYLKDTNRTYQHLYLTSNEEIKEGDYYITDIGIFKCSGCETKRELSLFKKIIATRDKSLTKYIPKGVGDKYSYPLTEFIPQIPESFIKAYVEAQGNIKEVLVEYEFTKTYVDSQDAYGYDNIKLKLRPDNTVIIHQAKTYTRDEVVILLDRLRAEMYRDYDSLAAIKDYEQWIQNNL